MDTIERYRELCTDGRAVGERVRGPSAAVAAASRWKSSTIVRLQWECAGQLVEIEHLYGLNAQVLPDRRTVAVLRSSPQGRFATALEFFDARGVPRFTLQSPLNLDGQSVPGEFAWFESPVKSSPPTVRVVYWAYPLDRYYLLDVSAQDGAIIAALHLQ